MQIKFSDEGETFKAAGACLDLMKGYIFDTYKATQSDHGRIAPGTFEIIGWGQLDSETEVKLIAREYDIDAGRAIGPELRLSWDTTIWVN